MRFICAAGLNRPNSSKLLDLDFTYFSDISTDLPEYGANQPDRFLLLFIADCSVQIRSTECC
jgi:hypothetical protein